MIDFAEIKAVSTPRGELVRIQRADGTVLWEKEKKYSFIVRASNPYTTASKAFSISVGKGA